MRKGVSALTGTARDRAMGLLANRYAIHAVVIVLTFAVTATNIYAGDTASAAPAGLEGHGSILGNVTQNGEDAIVIEEATTMNTDVDAEVSYLGGQALSTHDAVASGDDTGNDEGVVFEEDPNELEMFSPLANAVRVEPSFSNEEAVHTRTKVEEYVVTDGDTLGSIARDYGLRTETLLAANGLTVRSTLRIGQVLKILPVDGISYKVKSGDTIAKIAKIYDSEPEKIYDMNGISSTTALAVGDELILPDGRAPAPPAPKPRPRIATSIKDIINPQPSPNRNSTAMIWPTAARRITQYWKGRRHTGVDIAGPVGTAIYAAEDGVVAIAGWNSGGYGNMILLNHGGGIYTRYGHSSKLLVQAGDTVKKGDVIALIGSTGRSTGPHLHFEVMSGSPSNRVNPLEYVR